MPNKKSDTVSDDLNFAMNKSDQPSRTERDENAFKNLIHSTNLRKGNFGNNSQRFTTPHKTGVITQKTERNANQSKMRMFGQVLFESNYPTGDVSASSGHGLSLENNTLCSSMMSSNLDANYLETSRMLNGSFSTKSLNENCLNSMASFSDASLLNSAKESSKLEGNTFYENKIDQIEIDFKNQSDVRDNEESKKLANNPHASKEQRSDNDWRTVGYREGYDNSWRKSAPDTSLNSTNVPNDSILSDQESMQGLINFAVSDSDASKERTSENFLTDQIRASLDPSGKHFPNYLVEREYITLPNSFMMPNFYCRKNYCMPNSDSSHLDDASSMNDVLRQVMDMQVKVHKNIAQNPETTTSCRWQGKCSDFQYEAIQRAVYDRSRGFESANQIVNCDFQEHIGSDLEADEYLKKREEGKVYSRKVFAGGVPWEATEKSIAEAFVSSKVKNSSLRGVKSLMIEYPHRPSLSTSILSSSFEDSRAKDEISGSSHSQSMSAKRGGKRNSKITTNYFPGYVYLIFDHAELVNKAIKNCCVKQGDKYFFEIQTSCNSSSSCSNVNGNNSRGKRKQVEFVPFDLSDAQWTSDTSYIDTYDRRAEKQRNNTVFIGALHGQITARMLKAIMEDLFGEVRSVSLDLDKYNYPIGSAKVNFSQRSSLIKALEAGLIDVVTDRFKKRIQIDPYLQSSGCCMCQKNNQLTYFCRNKFCFEYFCKDCWYWRHNAPSGDLSDDQELRTHIPLTR